MTWPTQNVVSVENLSVINVTKGVVKVFYFFFTYGAVGPPPKNIPERCKCTPIDFH